MELKEENDVMKNQINKILCNGVVKFGSKKDNYTFTFNETTLNINEGHDITKLVLFSDLIDLNISTSCCECDRKIYGCDKSALRDNAKNNNVETLTIHNTIYNNQPGIYIEKLFDLNNFPNLKHLTINDMNTLTPKMVIDALELQLNKITKLTIKSCMIINVVHMQSYCQLNDIILYM